MTEKIVKIYCDGACTGNPGPGGWGTVLLFGETKKELSGYEAHTTNNRMELMSAIMGLAAIKTSVKLEVYTDSMYLKQGITIWIHNWKKNNWNGSKIKNQDLWQQLDELNSTKHAVWYWVKAHNGNYYNELADKLARQAIVTNTISKL